MPTAKLKTVVKVDLPRMAVYPAGYLSAVLAIHAKRQKVDLVFPNCTPATVVQELAALGFEAAIYEPFPAPAPTVMAGGDEDEPEEAPAAAPPAPGAEPDLPPDTGAPV